MARADLKPWKKKCLVWIQMDQIVRDLLIYIIGILLFLCNLNCILNYFIIKSSIAWEGGTEGGHPCRHSQDIKLSMLFVVASPPQLNKSNDSTNIFCSCCRRVHSWALTILIFDCVPSQRDTGIAGAPESWLQKSEFLWILQDIWSLLMLLIISAWKCLYIFESEFILSLPLKYSE